MAAYRGASSRRKASGLFLVMILPVVLAGCLGGDDEAGWGDVEGVPAGFADGVDDDTLAELRCSDGQVAESQDAEWVCGIDDLGAGTGGGVYAAGRGLVLEGSAFRADTVILQERVADPCDAGSSIRAIAADGRVTCEADDVGAGGGTYTAGPGLLLEGTQFRVNAGLVQSRIAGSCGAGAAIRTVNEDGTVDCEPDDGGAAATAGWALQGNGGTDPATQFLGTTDATALEVRVNNAAALRIAPAAVPNIVAGDATNALTAGVRGAAIGGGGGAGSNPTFSGANRVTDDFGTIAGGGKNRAGNDAGTLDDGWYATVGGGTNNVAAGLFATVAGGRASTAVQQSDTVGGGGGNVANGSWATVAGGSDNVANGTAATVAGGLGNNARGLHATVAGGANNVATATDSTIGGGSGNSADGSYAVVAGGDRNAASGGVATIAGGRLNRAITSYATVGGGELNAAAANYATVAGGGSNNASGAYGVIGGGSANRARGLSSIVPGGALNEANADYTLAAGRKAKADHQGAFVWGDSTDAFVTSNATNQFVVRASGGTRFYSNGGLSSGVTLAAGGGSWGSLSDAAMKENVDPVDPRKVLAGVAAMPIATWNYRTQDDGIRHMGPMAQDFREAFGLGEDEKHIGTVDADGVALAAIQGLYDVVQEQHEQIEALEARVADLEARRSDTGDAVSWWERVFGRIGGG